MNEMVLENEKVQSKTFYFVTKRIFDFCFALVCLIVLSPILLLIAIAIKLDSKGPVFYYGFRVGKGMKQFRFFKFRSMIINADEVMKTWSPELMAEYQKNLKLDNDPRITRVGKIIRKLSLDELPQIINIFKGDMSLIGPRPIMPREIERTGVENLKLMCSVTPGLTGWWACSGRSNCTWEEKTELELYYVRNCSWKLDIKCFFKTIESVVKKDGAK